MTARDSNELRDARVDAAWRAASREEPPPALDDAIRAAARRATGTGPRPVDARKVARADSLRPQRWWWPLAAAATIGVLVIGLLQLTEPERVGVAGEDKAVVSDTPTAAAGAKKQEASAPGAPALPVAVERGGNPPMPAAAPASTPPPPGTEREGTAPAPRPVAPGALRKGAAVAFPRDEGAARTDAAMPSGAEPTHAANAAAPPPLAEPFPADAVTRESKGVATGDAAAAPPVPAAATAAEASASGVPQGKLAAGRSQPAEEARGVAAAAAAAAAPKALATSASRAKTAPQLAVPDWIALIRKLRDEGRTDDAAKELAAFRAAHPDHETILPPDLRDWKRKER
jgi:hypothetical protein